MEPCELKHGMWARNLAVALVSRVEKYLGRFRQSSVVRIAVMVLSNTQVS